MFHWLETLGKVQDPLEEFYLSAGQGAHGYSLDELANVAGEREFCSFQNLLPHDLLPGSRIFVAMMTLLQH